MDNIEYKGIPFDEMKQFLEEKYLQYDNRDFIEQDPVSIPHRYDDLHDIEVAGFLTAAISWGRRNLILKSAGNLCRIMGDAPYDFVMSASDNSIQRLDNFWYRTFNSEDCKCFIRALRHVYSIYNSLEDVILEGMGTEKSLKKGISGLRSRFFEIPHLHRVEKHFADIERGAAGKRVNMFLRWMVRNDKRGVDFGLWKRISPSSLFIPLDLHSGNTARQLGLLNRKADDWKAVEELTDVLRRFDNSDPVKYDFALFGFGVNEKNK